MTSIAHIAAPAPFGGLERVLSILARNSVLRGRRVIVVLVLSPGTAVPEWAEAMATTGVIIEPLFLPPRAYLRERREVRGLLELYGIDVVHTHGYRCDVLHASTARQLGVACVSTAHGFASLGGIGKFYEWLQLRSWRSFDAVVAVSRPLASLLAAQGLTADRIEFIANGAAPDADKGASRLEARRALSIHASTRTLGWVGRFSAEKAPEAMIRAFAAVPDREARLCMIGDGPLWNRCRALGDALGLGDRLLLPGAIPDASRILRAFDVLCLSSLTEGTPMVLLEAAAASIAVVATDVGGVAEVLGPDGGYLVPPGDEAALTRAVSGALADPGESARRGLALHHRHTHRAENDWVSRYLELYDRVRRP